MKCHKCNTELIIEDFNNDPEYWSCPNCGEEKVMFILNNRKV